MNLFEEAVAKEITEAINRHCIEVEAEYCPNVEGGTIAVTAGASHSRKQCLYFRLKVEQVG